MRKRTHPNPDLLPARRRFLKTAAAACGVLGGFGLAPLVARAGTARSLSFVHTHTGEALTVSYRQASCYDADCLSAVNHLLRDFRNGEVHPIDPGLLDILCGLKDQSGSDAPFEVISGYRSPRTNSMLRGNSRSSGVAEHSLHIQGQAIDIRLGGVRTLQLAELARGLGRGGVGYYAASDFVHVDTGRVRHW
jgi:uncharacterized protein YcbK (DUF882 family)